MLLVATHRENGSIVFKDFFVLLGPPNAGKTTFILDFVGEKILGHENYRAIELASLAGDAEDVRREFYQLYNVLMVAIKMDVEQSDKVSAREITRALSHIISVSGGDPVEARKLREDVYMYYPAFKFAMISNTPPNINLVGEGRQAFFVRSKIMELRNRFLASGNFSLNSLSEEDIEATIITAIYALRLARMQGYTFTGTKDPEDAWLRYAEPRYGLLIYAMEKGYIELDPHSFADRDALITILLEVAKEYLSEKDPFLEDEDLKNKARSLVSSSQGGGFTKTYGPLLAKLGVEYDRGSGKFKGIRIVRKGEKSLVSYSGSEGVA
jgi:hypothetical protein